MERTENTRERLKNQFIGRSLSTNNFVESVTKNIVALSEYERLAETDPKLQDYLNNMLRPGLKEKDNQAWTEAKKRNTSDAYADYLSRFGQYGSHSSEAQKALKGYEQSMWQVVEGAVVKDEKTLTDALNKYLDVYPDGEHNVEAREMLDDIPWHIALRRNTLEGYLDYQQRYPHRRVGEVKDKVDALEDERDWNMAVKCDTTDAFETYLEKHPNGIHSEDARNRIENRSYEEMYVDELKEDPNSKGCIEIQYDVENGYVSWNAIRHVYGNDKADAIQGFKPPRQLPLVQSVQKTLPRYTEVYFWGLRGTGKTCAIGATIGCLTKVFGNIMAENGPGRFYFDELQRLFCSDGICTLPLATNDDTLPFMPFQFRHTDGCDRRAQIIDVAGEVFSGIYAHERSGVEKNDYVKNLERLLNNSYNNKIHFFIIEYGSDNNDIIELPGYGSVPKYQVMQAMMEYLKRNKTLRKSTYRVYVLVTKSDKIGPNLDRKAEVNNFIRSNNWYTVVNNLKIISEQIVGKNSFKNPIPFSIGDVFAKDLAVFHPEDARVVVDAIASACPKIRNNFFTRIFQTLNN